MAVLSFFVDPVEAKMRVDRLTIERAAGGPLALDVEVAMSDQEKALGLMFRTELADTTGMLFPYGSSHEITMWMRNTYIPLDMLFIRADGTIHRIEARAEPLSDRVIASEGPVTAVLELAAGAAERLGIKAGDKVIHPLIGAKSAPPPG
jgi:uncharacterized membrane protein (UPF0127 family)